MDIESGNGYPGKCLKALLTAGSATLTHSIRKD